MRPHGSAGRCTAAFRSTSGHVSQAGPPGVARRVVGLGTEPRALAAGVRRSVGDRRRPCPPAAGQDAERLAVTDRAEGAQALRIADEQPSRLVEQAVGELPRARSRDPARVGPGSASRPCHSTVPDSRVAGRQRSPDHGRAPARGRRGGDWRDRSTRPRPEPGMQLAPGIEAVSSTSRGSSSRGRRVDGRGLFEGERRAPQPADRGPVPPTRIAVPPRAAMPRSASMACRRKSAAVKGSSGSTRSRPWCGTRARSAALTLAVPMSMPRYTCRESALMISAPGAAAVATGAAGVAEDLGLAGRGRSADDDERRQLAGRHSLPGQPPGECVGTGALHADRHAAADELDGRHSRSIEPASRARAVASGQTPAVPGRASCAVLVRPRRHDRVDQHLGRPPEPAWLRSRPMASWSSSRAFSRRRLSARETSSGRRAAGVPGRGEKAAAKTWSKPTVRSRSSVASNCASVSPQKPTITSVVRLMPGIAARSRSTSSRYAATGVLPAHPVQHRVVARLDRQVEVLADRRALGHGRDEPVGQVPGMRRDEAQARDGRRAVGGAQAVDGAEQRGDVRPPVERQLPAERALAADLPRNAPPAAGRARTS